MYVLITQYLTCEFFADGMKIKQQIVRLIWSRCSWNQLGHVSGRFSCKDAVLN